MINIIEPEDHFFHEDCIDTFLRLLKIYQSFSLEEHEKERAIFIIRSDNKRGVYGGAVLYQQKVSELNTKIGKIVSNFQPKRESVWVARVGLYTEGDESTFNSEVWDLRENFYQDLLKIFREVGERETIDYLILKLCSPEFYQTKRHGYWPYIVEVSANDSSDGLFHGILSLNPRNGGGVQ